MKKLVRIKKLENGITLDVVLEDDHIGLMVSGDADEIAAHPMEGPDCLEKLFGKESVAEARRVLEFCKSVWKPTDPPRS